MAKFNKSKLIGERPVESPAAEPTPAVQKSPVEPGVPQVSTTSTTASPRALVDELKARIPGITHQNIINMLFTIVRDNTISRSSVESRVNAVDRLLAYISLAVDTTYNEPDAMEIVKEAKRISVELKKLLKSEITAYDPDLEVVQNAVKVYFNPELLNGTGTEREVTAEAPPQLGVEPAAPVEARKAEVKVNRLITWITVGVILAVLGTFAALEATGVTNFLRRESAEQPTATPTAIERGEKPTHQKRGQTKSVKTPPVKAPVEKTPAQPKPTEERPMEEKPTETKPVESVSEVAKKAEVPAPEERHTVPPVRTQVEEIRKQAKDERKKVEPPKKPRVESPEQLRKRCNDHSKNGWEEACRRMLRMQR